MFLLLLFLSTTTCFFSAPAAIPESPKSPAPPTYATAASPNPLPSTAADPAASPPLQHYSAGSNSATAANPNYPPEPPIQREALETPPAGLASPPTRSNLSAGPIEAPDAIWEPVLSRLRPVDTFYAQFVCRRWRSLVSPTIQAFRNHIRTRDYRANLRHIYRLLVVLRTSASGRNLEDFILDPESKDPEHLLLVERFIEDHPDIDLSEWDADKMFAYYVEQMEFQPPMYCGNVRWNEKDFAFELESRERKNVKLLESRERKNVKLFLLFVLMMAFYFWPSWADKKDRQESLRKGRRKAKEKKSADRKGKGKDTNKDH